jgi:plasmid stabilization system protein ParE
MRVRFTPRAFSDREAIYEYLVSRSPSGARNVMTRINATITLLAEQPAIGYRTENPKVRVRFLGEYPYKIFYRVRGDDLEILHIRHTARRPWVGSR